MKITNVMSTMAEQLGMELGKGRRCWIRAGVVCYIVESVENPGVFDFEPITATVFRTWVEQFVRFMKTEYVKGADGDMEPREVPKSLTKEAAETILQAPQFKACIPVVRRVNRVRLPYFRDEDGVRVVRLLPDGYDEETGVFTFGMKAELDEAMTLEQAVEWLLSLYSETKFPLRPVPGEEGKYRPCPRAMAVCWSALLSLYTTSLLSKHNMRMGFMFTANAEGAGKTTLVKLALATVMGDLRQITWSRDEEAMRTRVDTWLLSGYGALFFDNVKSKIDSELIEALMSFPTHTVRVFHTQRNLVVANETTVFITGNDTEASSDANRRFLYVELDMSNSDSRSDIRKRDLNDAWMLAPENRAKTLSALWALTKAWDQAGRPGPRDAEGNRVTGVTGFLEWCDIVGGIVTMATSVSKGAVGNPFEAPELKTSGDKDGRDVVSLVTMIVAGGKANGATFEDVCQIAMEHGLFERMLPELPDGAEVKDVLDKAARSKFAIFLSKKTGERKNGNGGKTYTIELAPGVKQLVRFFFEGSGRHKKFRVENVR